MKSTELMEQLRALEMKSSGSDADGRSLNPIMIESFREARGKAIVLVKEYLAKNGLLVDEELEL